MSSPRSRSAADQHQLLIDNQALRQLLQTLSEADVTSFNYEDSRIKLEIVRAREVPQATGAHERD